MGYDSITWLPLTAGLTALGLVLSYLAWRRNGVRAGIRGAAWSLLPIAAYMTGAIQMLWKMGAAIGTFATGWVVSPVKWAGIALAALAFVLYVSAGGRVRRKAARDKRQAARAEQKKAAGAAPAAPGLGASTASDATATVPALRTPAPVKAKTPAKGKAASPLGDDDDFKDIEEILRKRGI